jgi:hypothetical protein
VLDNVRVGDAGAVWVCTGRSGPSSTAKRPFFNVWSAPSSCRSAWQPVVGPQSSVAAENARLERCYHISTKLPDHVSEIFPNKPAK